MATAPTAASEMAAGSIEVPGLPSEERLELPAPPQLDDAEGPGSVLLTAMPMLASIASIAVFASIGGGGARHYLAAGAMVVAVLGMIAVQLDRQRTRRQRRIASVRADYFRRLDITRRRIHEIGDRHRRALHWHHPAPAALPGLAAAPPTRAGRIRIYERNGTDPRFLHVRYGVCDQPHPMSLSLPAQDLWEQSDPVAARAAYRLASLHRAQHDLPAWVDLHEAEKLEVRGPPESVRSIARALICSATAFHAPDHLTVAVITTEQQVASWDWIKWLPHTRDPNRADAVGPRRAVVTDLSDAPAVLCPGRDRSAQLPHLLMVLDHGAPAALRARAGDATAGRASTVLDLHATTATDHTVRMTCDDVELPGIPDRCAIQVAEAFARRLARQTSGSVARHDEPDPTGLLSRGDSGAFHAAPRWEARNARERLRVPIGAGTDQAPVHLDLKEAALGGMGPHGLVIGATGSGKSEFLRTLVLGLALTHSPADLNLVLIDFKGGATFAPMAPLPHVSAVITNLADELSLVDRMQDALSGELIRRQELLRSSGNLASIRDYEHARLTRTDLPPMPALFIVIDEFSELLSAKPELIDTFIAIGRLGRSLGLHLLLASQRLEEGRLRGLESHLSYRVGLRTFSAQESRAVLGVPDAYELPPTPGVGYLKPEPNTLVRFSAAYVSGPAQPLPVRAAPHSVAHRTVLPFTVRAVGPHTDTARAPKPDRAAPGPLPAQPSVLEQAVHRMARKGPAAHRIWLPPLDAPPTLDQLMPGLARDDGSPAQLWLNRGALVIPVGIVDRPRDQRRDVLRIDLTGAGGHLAVVGGPRSGKSTMLCTAVTALALTATPLEAQIFVLDYGGGIFQALAELPHVAGIASSAEPEVARRILAEVTRIVEQRERHLADEYGEVFVVVDGWGSVRTDLEEAEQALQRLATRGLTLGVHVIAASNRWADFRASTRDLFGSRLELRLGDAIDSELDRRSAALVPRDRPGRGLTPDGEHFLAALPRIDGDCDAATIDRGIGHLVARIATAWTGPPAPRLRLLPEQITLAQLHALAGASPTTTGHAPLWIALEESALAPVGLDPRNDPHLLILGDTASGKSSMLRALTREITRTRTPRQAQVVLLDYRRTLLGEVPPDYLLHYLTSAEQAEPALRDLAAYLHGRLPGPDVTPQQIRDRTWWSGADVFVVVDDYDLVSTERGSPIAALRPLLAQAADIGLHLTLARRTGGASRALYEPVIQTMRDLATPGLLLSGSPEEGPLLGNLRAAPARPGRARLITRARGVEVVQLAWAEPTAPTS